MGRRALIRQADLNRLFSSSRQRQRERERDELIRNNEGAKEMPVKHYLAYVEFNESTRAAKVHIQEIKEYRTIERYVTQNYVRYPIYSEWKKKSKKIVKNIKLINETLEKLNKHEDPLIRKFCHEIIIELNNPDFYPSWFLRDYYREKHDDAVKNINQTISVREKEFENFKLESESKNSVLSNEILLIAKKLTKLQNKTQKFETKIDKCKNFKKSVVKTIITLCVYLYYHSDKRLQKLNAKLKANQNLCEIYGRQRDEKMAIIAENNSLIGKKKNELITFCEQARNRKEQLLLEYNNELESITILTANLELTDGFEPLHNFSGFHYRKIMGCYVIKNTENNRCYVGKSKDVMKRIKQHFNGTEPKNIIFAEDYFTSKLSDRSSLFSVKIQECDEGELDSLEKSLIEIYDAYKTGYNSTRGNT